MPALRGARVKLPLFKPVSLMIMFLFPGKVVYLPFNWFSLFKRLQPEKPFIETIRFQESC